MAARQWLRLIKIIRDPVGVVRFESLEKTCARYSVQKLIDQDADVDTFIVKAGLWRVPRKIPLALSKD